MQVLQKYKIADTILDLVFVIGTWIDFINYINIDG